MRLTLDLPEELIKDIEFEAGHEEISVDDWLQNVVKRNVWRRELQDRKKGDRPHISEVIADLMKDLPEEDLAMLPKDGASEHDHYLYGTPKRNSCD
ncbi:MAG TPA: hypothetical protein VLV83_09080 [Acidobacteriota bacterium]|nr:hypothetical protein [Acidobacteriota bacterium]